MTGQPRPVAFWTDAWRERRLSGQLAPLLLLVAAVVLGGGGSPAPFNEMLLEWAALAALVAVVWLARSEPEPRLALSVALAVLALPALQLVPLPPALWQHLPGRAPEVAALALTGAETRWMPLSVAPARTLAALLALLVPLALLVLTARGGARLRAALVLTIGLLALLSAVVGTAQLAAAGTLNFYGHEHLGYLTGFQANRNAEADVLLAGMIALAAAARGAGIAGLRDPRGALVALALALLAGAVLFTGSRAGIALLVPTVGAIAWYLRSRIALPARRWRIGLALGALALLAAAGWALVANPAVERLAARFTERGEPRLELWTDALYAAGQYWPVGAGMGAFVPVFVAAERLEVVDPSYPNRAHNDFLELAVEAGAAGLVLLVALAALLALSLARKWRAAAAPAARAELVFAGASLIILAAHSVVDYPLRSMALAALAGVAAGIILAPDRSTAPKPPPAQQ